MSEHFVTSIDDVYPIKIGRQGPAGKLPTTIIHKFRHTVSRWIKWTFDEYNRDVKRFGRALIRLGLQHFDTINIIGFNSPEWCIGYLGAIGAGCIPVGVYTTNGAEACYFVASHSKARLILCENWEHMHKYIGIWGRLPGVAAIVLWDGRAPAGYNNIYSWRDFMDFGDDLAYDAELESRLAYQQPGHCSSIIYTSGTTGNPKGVMISHDNIVWTVAVIIDNFSVSEHDRIVSYLPLSHIAAQMIDIYGPVVVGLCVYFADKNALKGTLKDSLREIRPTVFFGVPRVYEKIQEGMLAVGRSRGPLLAAISAWAKQIGTQATEAKKNNQPYPWLFCLAYILVYRTIRVALGLDQCRAFFSGAAPLQPSTIAYFESLWMPISELYGMSESSGPQTYNVDSPGLRKSNSAGKAVPGTEMVISSPDAQGVGEICYRGRNVFMGYLYDGVKSTESIDEFGYLHSGDLGYIDTDGFLFITGRIKELIITAGGENVPPVPIENTIKEEMPAVSQAVVIGDGRKFLSVLLTLKTGVNEETGVPDCYLSGDAKAVAKSLNSPAYTVDEAIRCSRYQQYLAEGIQRVNQRAVSRAAEVRKWAVLPTDLSVAGGELTATMKVKRKEISVIYESVIDEMYRSEDI